MSKMGSIDDVASQLEGMNLNVKKDALVLLFKHARRRNGADEPRTMPDLEGICPGLLKMTIVAQKKPLEAVLLFRSWILAAKAVTGLWEVRLEGGHFFTPQLLEDDCDNGAFGEFVDRELKELFLCHLAMLETGETVNKCKSDIDDLRRELFSIQNRLKQRNSIALFSQLTAERSNVSKQLHALGEQLAEYLNALNSLKSCIHHKCFGHHRDNYLDDINDESLLLRLENNWTWHHLHCFIERETLRFKERLPLYGKRSDILQNIHNNQVVVLSGETGSGKSTQLAQYIVDAGLIKEGASVVCTQPRRVAVMTLFDRVTEESRGCCAHDPLVGSLVCASHRMEQYPKIMFVTDHVLLQLCLEDELLSQFECVLVDEAHERSLSTDLLLAMLKRCLTQRPDLKVVIMSATADTELLSTYFGGCVMYHVVGRSFPVEFIYSTEEDHNENADSSFRRSGDGQHVLEVVQTVNTIISHSGEGDVLAFLTSQAEVEWACSQHYGSNTLILPLHGRLQASEQQRVFITPPHGMRKVVFATNVAETSLTIPGIKFVVDCGLAKESCIDPKSGMNVLKICQIDKSAAMQRAGRAGRTQPGVCYRLYSRAVFDAMVPHRVPEILRVHLGVAILKLTALGVQKIEAFDFIDSPCPAAICLAVENLSQLGAIATTGGKIHLTSLGWKIVKLGVDPCLGFIALKSLSEGVGREGIVIAGLLSCSGSIFFRAGSEEDKLRSDCLKMRFCHPDGDIFTLLCVYKEWDRVPKPFRNKWCAQNSINAKSMRRCQDFIEELKGSLKRELQTEPPCHWIWSEMNGENHWGVILRKILLSSMPKNVAVFSGHEGTGYDVVSIRKQAYLHPSSSCLVFGQSPIWVVFGNLLCTTREFLTSITVVEPQWLSEINLSPPYDIIALESNRLHKVIISDLSRHLLTRLCGKANKSLKLLTNKILQGSYQRCCLEADYEKEELQIYTTLGLMKRAEQLVKEAIAQEKKWLNSECIEKCIFRALPGRSSPAILFGAGAEIKEVIMQGEFVTVEVSNVGSEIEDHEVFKMFDMCDEGVAGFCRNGLPENSNRKWGTVTFNSRKGATEAVSHLHNANIGKCRIETSGLAIVRCKTEQDQLLVVTRCCGMLIHGSHILCKPDRKGGRTEAFVYGLGTEVTEAELLQGLQQSSGCVLENVHLLRHPARDQPSVEACREALEQEIQRFVPITKFQAIVLGQHAEYFTKAVVRFDESEHENAARAIAHLEGRTLSICQSWQTISCQNTFFSSVSCSRAMYSVLKEDINDLMVALKQQTEDVEMTLMTRDGKGGCFVKISAGSLRTAAVCKSAFERLLEGTLLGEGLDGEADLRLVFTREGIQIARSVELQTRTYIVCDKRSQVVKIFGSAERRDRARSRLIKNLSQLRERKNCHEIELRGGGRPYGLMREIVRKFGVDLVGLRKLVTGGFLSLDQRRHILLVHGSRENMLMVNEKIEEVESLLRGLQVDTIIELVSCQDCSICFCEVEDKYSLVGCGHGFCRACVREQILSAIRHREGFPLTCAYPGCSQKLLLLDLEALLTADQQDELQKASICAFVASNKGKYKFCITPDCPSVYRVMDKSKLFTCGACAVRLCMSCNREFHLGLSCQEYEVFKQDPDLSLKSWRRGKQHVKCCPSCGSTIEKVDGCNHVLCNCKAHLCWLCLSSFHSSEDCYSHLQSIHGGYI
ncbi:hypothetical protein GOP47_0007379 [Adiantum capillus-veneris]|uniref:Uncharacterized protein n=1 Tax=Adiantum capillus-veneris TaxID=13818 RepID=A0A9D4V171_ADICA|nr:hypothetical protein GOP47_0007379 [Adiantum capillus-veneris]